MSTIPLLARRRLCNTFNAQEVGQLRAALQDACSLDRPVAAIKSSNTFVTMEPNIPLNVSCPPATLPPAMRPCLLAVVPRGT